MKNIKIIIKSILSIIINIAIYIISICIPKSKNIWIFGGWFGSRFADNSRYFYLYCNDSKEELGLKHVIWITNNDEIYIDLKSKGFEVYKKWSIKSIWYHFRAKFVFVDQGASDVNKYFCIRTIKINLWHGFPLKKIGSFSEKQGIKNEKDDMYNKYFKIGGWNDYYVQATSKLSKNILSEAFSVSKDKVIVSGYSRNDVFTQEYWKIYLSKSEKNIIEDIKKFKSKNYKIIFYLPTFRDNKSINLLNIKNVEEKEKIETFLEKNKLILITKFHFAQSQSAETVKYNNIINLNSCIDVYPILNDSDILITDYSSVYFDFLITNKPIIFYPFDLDYYSDNSKGRGLIFDYNEFTPGAKVFTIDELLSKLQDVIKNTYEYQRKYKKQYDVIKNNVFDDNTDNGSKQLAQRIKKYFKGGII